MVATTADDLHSHCRKENIYSANIVHLDNILLLWTPAQRKRASMLYFADVFIYLFFFYGRLILRPWLTEVRESFTRGGP